MAIYMYLVKRFCHWAFCFLAILAMYINSTACTPNFPAECSMQNAQYSNKVSLLLEFSYFALTIFCHFAIPFSSTSEKKNPGKQSNVCSKLLYFVYYSLFPDLHYIASLLGSFRLCFFFFTLFSTISISSFTK